jgi:hypothetical protein
VHTLDCLLLDAGLRIDEALGLKLVDVDFDNLLVTVFGKGQKERRIPFSFEMRKRLWRFMKVRDKQGIRSDLVFASRDDTRWHQRNALRSHYLLLDKVGVARCGFHRLRHTMATQYLKAGGEVVRLSKQLGHTQISTTMAYEHLLTEDLQAPHQRLSILSSAVDGEPHSQADDQESSNLPRQPLPVDLPFVSLLRRTERLRVSRSTRFGSTEREPAAPIEWLADGVCEGLRSGDEWL